MKKKKYNLYLINPDYVYHHYGLQRELSNILGKAAFVFSPALSIIASLTPRNYKIRIINEEIEKIPYNKKPDLVGITAPLTTATQVYKIADRFRAMNVPVIIGGNNATFMTDEAAKHADSVVVGEAESVWHEVLNDFENDNLKKIYKSEKPYEFKKLPKPRWDLYRMVKNLNYISVQVSRGCPYNCEFCIVSKLFGRKQRYRQIDNVIEELKSLPVKRVFFVDDNLTFDKKYIKEFLARIKPLGLSWVCQSSIEIIEDDELLQLMADAGCLQVLIGFESLNPKSLEETGKYQNKIEDYNRAISKVHSYSMSVIGSFVVGFDNDDLSIFDRIYDFSVKNDLIFTMISMLTVAPGTALYDRMKNENRLLPFDQLYFNGSFPCAEYKNIPLVDMYDKYYETLAKLFSTESMGRKIINILKSGVYAKKKSFTEVSFFEKIKSSVFILKNFYFTKDRARKEFFVEVFKLGVNKTAKWDYIVLFIFIMSGFGRYVESSKDFFQKERENILRIQKEFCGKDLPN